MNVAGRSTRPVNSTAAPEDDILRTVQGMLPPLWSTVPPFNTLKRGAARFSIIVTNPKQLQHPDDKPAKLRTIESNLPLAPLRVQLSFTMFARFGRWPLFGIMLR